MKNNSGCSSSIETEEIDSKLVEISQQVEYFLCIYFTTTPGRLFISLPSTSLSGAQHPDLRRRREQHTVLSDQRFRYRIH